MRPGGFVRPASERSQLVTNDSRPRTGAGAAGEARSFAREFEAVHGHEPTARELVTLSGYEEEHVTEALDAVEASVALNQTVGRTATASSQASSPI